MKSFILMFVWLPTLIWAQPNFTGILQAIRRVDMAVLTANLDSKVELTIGTTDHVADATKTAELLGDFLKKNRPTECTIVHSGSASDKSSHYLVGRLVAGGKTYRLYILFKARGEQYLIQEMRLGPA